MTDLNEIQNTQFNINQCQENMRELISTADKTRKQKLSLELKELKEKLIKSNEPINIARGAIISYVLNYSNNNSIFKTKKAKNLVKEFIDNFLIKEVIEKSLINMNDKFKDPSPFRTMISFRKEIKCEKKYLELYFKIMLINQNIADIIDGINILLQINNQRIVTLIKNSSFKNPYSIIVLRELLNELLLIENEFNDKILLETVLNNFKYYYIFHCPVCMGILYINFVGCISITCLKCPKYYFVENPFFFMAFK